MLIEAEKALSALASLPERFSPTDDSALKAWGIRFVPIKNYLAFYVVSEPEQDRFTELFDRFIAI